MENTGFMVVSRTKPPEFTKEDVYVGKILELKEIPMELRLEESEARKYLWIVNSVVKKENALEILSGAYNYNELLDNEKSYGNKTYREILFPINPEVKKGLVGLLS